MVAAILISRILSVSSLQDLLNSTKYIFGDFLLIHRLSCTWIGIPVDLITTSILVYVTIHINIHLMSE
jgi:hypothetical protein